MLDGQLFGLRPAGHHLTSVMLHAINTVLLFVLLHTMTQSRWRSALVAALFGLHPLHVESVAWISERKDVLSAFFGLLCLLAYVRYVRCGEARRWRYYALALVFFCLGLMSKPMLVTWPFVLLLLDYWPLRTIAVQGPNSNNRSFQKLLLEKIPFFAMSAISCVVALVAQTAGGALPWVDRVAIG